MYSIGYVLLVLVVVLFLICAYLQIKMCKRNHEACHIKLKKVQLKWEYCIREVNVPYVGQYYGY